MDTSSCPVCAGSGTTTSFRFACLRLDADLALGHALIHEPAVDCPCGVPYSFATELHSNALPTITATHAVVIMSIL